MLKILDVISLALTPLVIYAGAKVYGQILVYEAIKKLEAKLEADKAEFERLKKELEQLYDKN